MNDLCTLAHYKEDDLSTHAVSLAVMAWVLRHANAGGSHLDRAAFHRAADLALLLFREEERRFASADASAPLLDSVYLKAFVPDAAELDEAAEALGTTERTGCGTCCDGGGGALPAGDSAAGAPAAGGDAGGVRRTGAVRGRGQRTADSV